MYYSRSMTFNQAFVDACYRAIAHSDDPHRKVGCVIVKDDDILVEGANKILNGAKVTPERLEKPAKYIWIEHAERTAIYRAAKDGICLDGSTMYMSWWPCIDCCRAIINSGIKHLVVPNKPNFSDDNWGNQFRITDEMIKEVGIDVIYTNDT